MSDRPSVRHTRVARLLTRPAGRVGSGRIGSGQKIYRKGRVGSGRVQFGQRPKFNFKVPWYLYFILQSAQCSSCIFSISRVVFSVYTAMWRMMNLYQRGVTLWHDYIGPYCSPHQLWTCRHQYRRLSRCFAASCGGRRSSAVVIPLLAHTSHSVLS